MCKKVTPWNKGKSLSKETKEKISKALIGRKTWNKGMKLHYSVWNKGTKGACKKNSGSFKKGENTLGEHHNFKGDNASYRSKHKWVENNFGKPEKCEHCNVDGLTGREIHWASISHEYKRERDDWLRLCRKCHFS